MRGGLKAAGDRALFTTAVVVLLGLAGCTTGRGAEASAGTAPGTTAAGSAPVGAEVSEAAQAEPALDVSTSSSTPVEYRASFENRVHHEARVEVVFRDVPEGPLDVVMSRTSPGRYALHGFAKNVYAETATDAEGRPLELERVSPFRWRVSGHDGTVRFAYTLFADHADGTFPGVDATHAHLNTPASFAFAPELADRPVRIQFVIPEGSGWKVATQLPSAGGPGTYSAPDLAYFMDSPTELSDFDLVTWEVGTPGDRQTIRLAVHHQGTRADAERFAELIRPVVDEQAAVFGELPEFDYGTYTFIADYLPWVYGDGMEHRNSTILTSRRPLEGGGALRNLGTVAHEFFHAWNMERIRARSIEPFDFTRANTSSELWFGEGFTSYYDGLSIVRAGHQGLEGWASQLTGLLNATINAPGRRFRGPAAMSRQAPLVDAAAWVDATNLENTFLSYYTYGAALAAGLDLILRTRYDTTLDAYMRAVWERHGEPEIPYTTRSLQRLLREVTGDSAFAARFFERSIQGSELPKYARLLESAGLVLRKANPGRATLGVNVEGEDGGAVVAGRVRAGTAAWDAGLELGDRILGVEGRAIRTPADLDRLLEQRSPGEEITVRYHQRGRDVESRVALREDPSLEVVTFENVDRPVSQAVREFRRDWLGSHAGDAPAADTIGWTLRRPPTDAEFRGVDAAPNGVGWAVGRGGVFARTTDGGETWGVGVIPRADSLFGVAVDAFGADTAHVLTTDFDGGLASIHRTVNGGRTWLRTHRDARPGAFYDGMAFWDSRRGVAFGDPIDGRLTIVRTEDGREWVPAEQVPLALEGEAGFAASGSGLAVAGSRHAWIGTGGGSHARVLRTTDGGRTWTAARTPMAAGPTGGIFGVAFRDTLNGVAVGGSYTDTTSAALNVLRTRDGGRTWELVSRSAPVGVRYGVAYVPGTEPAMLVAVGPSGSGYSLDDGETWHRIDRTGYNAVSFSGPEDGWAAGVRGLLARWR